MGGPAIDSGGTGDGLSTALLPPARQCSSGTLGHGASPPLDAQKAAQAGTLLAELITELTVTGQETRVLFAHEQSFDPDSLLDQHLVAHRGLHTSQTSLLGAIDDRATPLCTPFAADQLLRNSRAWHPRLAEAGLPVPPAVDRAGWASVFEAGKGGEIVVERCLGRDGAVRSSQAPHAPSRRMQRPRALPDRAAPARRRH